MKDVSFAPEQEPKLEPVRPLHGSKARQEDAIPVGKVPIGGRYGRIFPVPQRRPVPSAALTELAEAMRDVPTDDDPKGDGPILAGYTYLGQFIDHDVTFDPTPVPEQLVDPQQLLNFRTPALDLDSLYGLGPAAQPYLYQRENPAKFFLGTVAESNDLEGKKIPTPGDGGFDLPRNAQGFATIGDPRNDENLIVAQLHLLFLKFHNAVADVVEPDPAKQPAAFAEIRREVTWHYQWIVLHDFLAQQIADPAVVKDVLAHGRKRYRFDKEPFIPVEFSVAAYRFGHSLVRDSYDYNRFFGPTVQTLAAANLDLLFLFTGPRKERRLSYGDAVSTPLPSHWIIDWRRFFAVGTIDKRNPSRLVNAQLAPTLHDLVKMAKVPSAPGNLAARNLIRGEHVGLPIGQSVAALYEQKPIEPERIAAAGPDGAVAARHGLDRQTPLWYYFLKEAELEAAGRHLGPTGSRLCAEVFLGLLEGDPLSFISQQPTWQPWLGREKGRFTMVDLIEFVDGKTPVINPLG